jgi:putative oxidoreductase
MKLGIRSMSLGKRRLVFCMRLIVGGLFLYAGLSKIGQPYKFAAAIQAYQLLPQFFVGLAAALIPWTEAVCGLALVLGLKSRSALLVSMILLFFFIFIVGLTMSRGLDIDCGCGLLANRRVGWSVLAEDFTLLFVISWLYFLLLADLRSLPQKPR